MFYSRIFHIVDSGGQDYGGRQLRGQIIGNYQSPGGRPSHVQAQKRVAWATVLVWSLHRVDWLEAWVIALYWHVNYLNSGDFCKRFSSYMFYNLTVKSWQVVLSSLFKMHVCEMILETEGVLGYVSLDCFPLDLIPLDIDLLSMELPEFLRTFYMVSNLNTTKFRSAEMSGGFRWTGYYFKSFSKQLCFSFNLFLSLSASFSFRFYNKNGSFGFVHVTF